MNSLTLLLAQAAPAAGTQAEPNFLVTMMPMVPIFIIFYFLLIRPQQKKAKEHEKLVSSVKSGDKVVTGSGIHAIVTNVKERTVILKVADNVKIEFDRAAIVSVEKVTDPSPAVEVK